jgi:hypothetical protein
MSASDRPFTPAQGWLIDACRWSLTQRTNSPAAEPAPQVPPGVDDAAELIARHRLFGLLRPWLDRFGFDTPTTEALQRAARQQVLRGLHATHSLVQAVDALSRHDISYVVFKGPALAAVQGLDPASRGSGDVDILVAHGDLAVAIDALAGNGWQLTHPERSPTVPTPPWRRRICDAFEPEVTLTHPNLARIDLHWRLLRSGRALDLDVATACSRSVTVDEIDPRVSTLCPTDALRHLAAHHNKDAWGILRHVVDVALLAPRIDAEERRVLAVDDHNVALALAIGAHLDPQLLQPTSARIQRLADLAWFNAVTERHFPVAPLQVSAREAFRARRGMVEWQVRSAPTLLAGLHPVVELALPVGALRDPRPLGVGIYRDLRSRIGG